MAQVMAASARSSVFLPTVKCSNCNVKIEISLMGEHVCSQVATSPEFQFLPLNGLFSPSFSSAAKPSASIMPITVPQSWADTPEADSPTLPHHPYMSKGRSASTPNESIPNSGERRRSPSQSSSRKGISSQPIVSPSSNSSISQDYAFPPSSNLKSRSKADTSSPATVQSSTTHRGNFEVQSSFAPLSPRDNGPGSVLQRMDTIVPGPFQLGNKADFRQSRHKKTASMSSSKDFTYPPTAKGSSTQPQRPSTSGSTTASKPFRSSISERRLDRDGSYGFKLPPIPTQLKPSHQTPSMEKSGHENRSNRYPADKPSNGNFDGLAPHASENLKPSLHVTKPSMSINSDMRSPPEIESAGTSKISYSDEAQGDILGNSPPATISTQPIDSKVDNHSHTPTDSVASNYSSGSDSRRSGSSTSTPPQSGSPQRQMRGPYDRDQVGSMNTDLSFTKERRSAAVREAALPHRIAPLNLNRPTYSRSIDEIGKPGPHSPVTPTIQSIQSGRPLLTSPDSYFSPQLPLQSESVDPAPVPLLNTAPTPSTRRPKKASKGNCKGCKEPIHGKSVSSADGRLTGRYHKRCFVCTTCKEPFQTTDFYILEDQPYCGRHYHLLNNSVCTRCDQGIEGQYLETELKQKFHPKCFTCQSCAVVLRGEYFETNGKTYCERHPFGSLPQPSRPGLGRRFPERRTTRLMMM